MRIATASAKPRNDVVSDGQRNDVRDDLMMGPMTGNVMKTKTNKSQRLVKIGQLAFCLCKG